MFVALVGAVAPAHAALHACPDGHGDVVYQDEDDPCVPPPAPKRVAAPRPTLPAVTPVVRVEPNHVSATARPSRAPAVASAPAPDPDTAPAPPHPALIPRAVDPARVPVEKTWRRFLAALNTGDRTAALACLTAGALADQGPRISSLPLDELRKTAAGLSAYHLEGDSGPVWSIRVTRENARPKWIFLERAGGGEWKIAAM